MWILCENDPFSAFFYNLGLTIQFTPLYFSKYKYSDDMPAGQTPHAVTLLAHGEMVERVQPGDRVAVTGIYRAVPARLNPRMRNISSVYRTSIDVLHFRKTDQSRLHQVDDG